MLVSRQYYQLAAFLIMYDIILEREAIVAPENSVEQQIRISWRNGWQED